MSLAPGNRLGPYEITGRLGEGGMGEVFRALDTRIDRTVAIKILSAGFGQDAPARERFDREARAISQLDHPHICALHDVGTQDGVAFLVMQFVAGETLASRLTRGPIPVDETIALARQIADALEAAHERGTVHRDLKPANVMVTVDGVVKVLDFGLAKMAATAEGVAGATSATAAVTSPAATEIGVILGTAAYMSPEQARGKSVDKRTDVWAFGCVLFEMLTGMRAFPGETMTDVLAAVVHKEPNWSDLPPALPPHIDSLLKRCLQKDPRQRLRDIGEARIALEQGAAVPATAAADGRSMRSQRGLWGLVAALAAGVMVLGAYAWRITTREPGIAEPVSHLSMTFPLGMHLGQPHPSLAFSPDGRRLVYTGNRQDGEPVLWMRTLDQLEPTALATTGFRNAFFSPDGQSVGLTGSQQMFRVAAAGGPLVPVCEVPGGVAYGGTWTTRDQIVFAVPTTGLWRVAAAGGTPERIAAGRFFYPDALPDGRHVVVTADNPGARTSDDLRIVLINIETGAIRPLVEGGTYVRYAQSGHLVYLRNGTLTAVPFDVTRGEIRGTPVAMVPNVFMNPALTGGNFALSPTGTLAYAPGTAKDFQNALLTVGADGPRPLTEVRRAFGVPKVSPDGTRVAVTVSLLQNAVWLLDIERGLLSRLTPDGYDVGSLAWLPDGRSLVVAASTTTEPRNLYLMRAEAGAPLQRLTNSGVPQTVGTFTPDGKQLVFVEGRPTEGPALWIMSLEGDRSPRRLLDRAMSPALSKDGNWLAFESGRSGTVTSYVVEFPAMKETVQVAPDGGRFPVWSSKGRLYYRQIADSSIMAVDVGGTPMISRPQFVARVPDAAIATAPFDLMHDGRVLVTDSKGIGWTSELKIVLNWFTELRQKAPSSN